MQTYKYKFPANGQLDNEHADAARELAENLKDSPDCLAAWCIFPSDSNIVDHVSFDLEEDGSTITAVNVHTYTQPYEGTEQDFRDCVAGNLENTLPGVTLTGDIEYQGKEGDVPKTLYHIAEKKDLDNILEKGLIPDSGKNQYKSHEDFVYLTNEKDLAPWLSILPHLEDPVLLKINTSESAGIEQGRVFDDRDYVEGGQYTEYRTTETVPASAISVVDTTNDKELLDNLETRLITQIGKGGDPEAERGYSRFMDLGALEDSFSKAVDGIPYQMTLADYGLI